MSGEGRAKNPQRAPGELVGSAATVNARRAVKAKHIVTVDRPAAEIFPIARAWAAKLPDVQVVNEVENQIIAWKTSAGSTLKHAGSVNVRGGADGTSEVKIEIDYEPASVAFGMLFDDLTAKLLGTQG
jgi:uncharacterized membrane protein